MEHFVLHPEAISDIDGIWEYSVRNWGVARANRYVGEIRAVFEKVAENPRRGRLFDKRRPNHRIVLVGSHIAIYKVVGEEVTIMRVLHQRMDIPRNY